MKNTAIKRSGISLIEVILSLAILSVIIGISSVSFHTQSSKYKLVNAVREIHSRMNYARFMAIFESAPVRVKFDPSGYTVERFDSSQNKWLRDKGNILEGVVIQANNNPIFYPQGTVSHLASIYISNSWGKYKITLAISGRIKVVKF